MQKFTDTGLAAPLSPTPTLPGLIDLSLAQIDTWMTSPAKGGDGWGEVKTCLFVCVTTSEGLVGWGEAFVLPCREKAVAEIIHALGRSAGEMQAVSPQAFRNHAVRVAAKHRSLDFAAASSALEMALWDICGKRAGKPLCALWGGDHSRGIPVYGNIWSDTQWDAGSLERRATELVAQGYGAVKIHPMLNHSAQEAAHCVTRVRAAIGDDIHLMVDLDSQDDIATPLQVAGLIGSARPYWFEEPVDGEEIQSLARVRRITGLPIVTGEKQSGLTHFRNVLAADAADILNPDIAGVGGLLDMIQLAELADRQDVKISPHCWNSMTVAAAAMLHVCAAIPNAEMAEIYPEYIAHGELFATTGFQLNGAHAYLSGKPGLGVEIDTSALESLSHHHHSTCLTIAEATT
ncbi:MAG: mandelate racemase/muconate lactonizing enzyme family protein [Pseudomonadota bacterium]